MKPKAVSTREPDRPAGEVTGELNPGPELVDEQGPIPTFPPRQFDEHGRIIPISEEERRARHSAALRALRALDAMPDGDPPGTEAEMMRNIDARRPPGRKVFEGLY